MGTSTTISGPHPVHPRQLERGAEATVARRWLGKRHALDLQRRQHPLFDQRWPLVVQSAYRHDTVEKVHARSAFSDIPEPIPSGAPRRCHDFQSRQRHRPAVFSIIVLLVSQLAEALELRGMFSFTSVSAHCVFADAHDTVRISDMRGAGIGARRLGWIRRRNFKLDDAALPRSRPQWQQ